MLSASAITDHSVSASGAAKFDMFDGLLQQGSFRLFADAAGGLHCCHLTPAHLCLRRRALATGIDHVTRYQRQLACALVAPMRKITTERSQAGPLRDRSETGDSALWRTQYQYGRPHSM